jgi:hypothetical protein
VSRYGVMRELELLHARKIAVDDGATATVRSCRVVRAILPR